MKSKRYSNLTYVNREEDNTTRKKTLHFIKNKSAHKRLVIYFISSSIILSFLTYQLFLNKYILHQNRIEYKVLQNELKELQKEGKMLSIENKLLDTDEYIEKIARQEYFLSKEGEIIFRINTKIKKKK